MEAKLGENKGWVVTTSRMVEDKTIWLGSIIIKYICSKLQEVFYTTLHANRGQQNFLHPETETNNYFILVLEILLNSQENTCARVSFSIKLHAEAEVCNFINKETLAQVFYCKFCEISKNTILTEQLLATASKQNLEMAASTFSETVSQEHSSHHNLTKGTFDETTKKVAQISQD